MRDPVEAFIDAERLGTLEQRIPLGGQLPHNGAPLAANLCRTSRGLFVVGARDAARGCVLDAGENTLRYVRGRFGDSIEIGGVRLGVPIGSKARVLEAIAISRLRGRGPKAPALALRRASRFIEKLPDLYAWWLAAELGPDELVLAALITGDVATLPSEVVEDARARPVLIMTERRVLLVALSAAGDARQVELQKLPPQLTENAGKLEFCSGDQRWTSAKNNAECFRELTQAFDLAPPERLLNLARANWLGAAGDPERVAWTRYLIERAGASGSSLAPFARYMVAAELSESTSARPDPTGALEGLREVATPGQALAGLWTSWRLGEASARELLGVLSGLPGRAEPWCSELELALHERSGANGSRKLELCARVAGQRGDEPARLEATLALACSDPLNSGWLDQLLAVASGSLLIRAKHVAALLGPGNLVARSRPRTDQPRALKSELIDEALAHPLTREQNPLGRLQALLAVVPRPDLAQLRDYVEQLSPERGRMAHRALERAGTVLGYGAVQAYVSRGSKSVGVCAYEGEPALVLIGSRHLDPNDEYAMTEPELEFTLACEVAHLRLGHARVTSSEVWAGALSRSRQGFDLVLGILPMLKGWRFADRVQHWTRKLPPDLVRRVVSRAGEIAAERQLDEAAKNSQVLSRLNEQLVAAHRVMQLSADRAGLLLVSDPGVALRAMLLVRPDYRAWLEQVERVGLAAALDALEPEQKPEFEDLAVRVRALLGFYLSREYESLERELWDAHSMLE